MAADAPCFFDEQCDGVCTNKSDSAKGYGVCAAVQIEGAECSPDPDDGHLCAPGSVCINLRCVRQATVSRLNETCVPGSFRRCAQNLFCDGQTCREQKVEDADCTELLEECSLADDLFCDPEVRKCRRIPISNPGEHCYALGDPGGSTCAASSYCEGLLDFTGVAFLEVGATCSDRTGMEYCTFDAVCAQGTCRAVTELSCAGGPIVVVPEVPATFVFDIPHSEVELQCPSGALSVLVNARYLNDSDHVEMPVLESAQMKVDTRTYPLFLDPDGPGRLDPQTATAVTQANGAVVERFVRFRFPPT